MSKNDEFAPIGRGLLIRRPRRWDAKYSYWEDEEYAHEQFLGDLCEYEQRRDAYARRLRKGLPPPQLGTQKPPCGDNPVPVHIPQPPDADDMIAACIANARWV